MAVNCYFGDGDAHPVERFVLLLADLVGWVGMGVLRMNCSASLRTYSSDTLPPAFSFC